MVHWTLVFLVIALIAGALGLGGIVGTSAGIMQILVLILALLLVVSIVASLLRRAE